jgi:hypothetical protein
MDGIDLRYILDILWLSTFLYLLYSHVKMSARIRYVEESVTRQLTEVLHLADRTVKLARSTRDLMRLDGMPYPPGTDDPTLPKKD